MEMVCYRLWEWYVITYSNVLQLMQSVLHYMTRLSYNLRQQCLTVCGNDM
jgi:hypothetical protein